MDGLIKVIQNVVGRSVELKDKYTQESSAPIEFACVFCQSEKEYSEFTKEIEKLGKIETF